MKYIEEHKISELKQRIPVEIGVRIRIFREEKKLTQTELAMMIGKDRQYLYKIEKGKVTSSIFTISVIAYALDISLSELIGDIQV
ncbi:transcriptional regulator with XRE-family HTH domain [Chryseobacterium vietnamense]|uniref:helix-turn-helix domain-containing protein n=1 Tax=Chryseobacterium vietnamense TaxID=866785 RepID=UPI00285C55AF|nr:helix-turn-helix transcriptional regulator [Chryseobacterium vietnamense]MDR6489232.1 transcriptional regulator with XRE-family HTH domain [Chryseobacterium vietnamense]